MSIIRSKYRGSSYVDTSDENNVFRKENREYWYLPKKISPAAGTLIRESPRSTESVGTKLHFRPEWCVKPLFLRKFKSIFRFFRFFVQVFSIFCSKKFFLKNFWSKISKIWSKISILFEIKDKILYISTELSIIRSKYRDSS